MVGRQNANFIDIIEKDFFVDQQDFDGILGMENKFFNPL